MSQHWHTDEGRRVTVLCGWDPPLGYFFMVVWETGDRQEAETEPHDFSNLDTDFHTPFPQQLEPLTQHLEDRWGVTLPDELIEQLEEDRRLNR